MIDLENFRTVIFHHIPKTAGTTMYGILEQVEDPDRIHTLAPRNEPDHEASVREFLEMPEEELRRIRILRGHDLYGFDRYLPQPSAYFTLLRDPARRLVSSYHHLRGAPAHLPERVEFLEDPPSLREYVERGDIYLGRDSLLKSFLGYREDPGDVSRTELLERAETALHEHYALVGLTERFDETLVLCAHTFGWSIEGYVTRNVGRHYRKDEVDPSVLELYRELNPGDVAFHRMVRELFEARVHALGARFEQELERFRRSNVWFNRRRKLRRGLGRLRRLLRPGGEEDGR